MEIIALTDLHGSDSALQELSGELSAADVVLLTGDLTHFGGRGDAATIVDRVRESNENVLAVHGNCDRPEVAAYLDDEAISLHGRHRVVDGVAFLGAGGSLPAPGSTPSEHEEDELAGFLADAADDLDEDLPWVLVCHQPPVDTDLDRISSGEHVGSRAVREFIEARAPLVCFCGHIHEASGRDAIGGTELVNAGPARHGGYALARIDGGLSSLEIRSL